MSSPALTAGALAVSLGIAGGNLWHWYKRGKDPKKLVHFGSGFALGGLATICGGLLGVLAGWSAAVGNTAGRSAVSSTTGAGKAVMNHGNAGQLSPGGSIVTFLLLVGFVIAWRAAPKDIRLRLIGGFFCGSTLVITVGIAGLFAHVVGLVNGVGDPGYNWIDGVTT